MNGYVCLQQHTFAHSSGGCGAFVLFAATGTHPGCLSHVPWTMAHQHTDDRPTSTLKPDTWHLAPSTYSYTHTKIGPASIEPVPLKLQKPNIEIAIRIASAASAPRRAPDGLTGAPRASLLSLYITSEVNRRR